MKKMNEKMIVRTSGINGKVAKFKKVVTVAAGTPGVTRGFVEVRYANTIDGTYMGEWLESVGEMKVYEKVGRNWVEVESAIEPEVESTIESAIEPEVESADDTLQPIGNTRYYRGCDSAKDAVVKVEFFHYMPGRTGMVEAWMETWYFGSFEEVFLKESLAEQEAFYYRYYEREMNWETETIGDWQLLDGRYSKGYWKAAARYSEPVCR